MNMWEAALATYDANRDIVGVQLAQEGYTPLSPVGHLTTTAKFEITLDPDGSFVSARAVDKKEPKIIIPVTEESAGRTSGLSPHGLCEQVGYLSGLHEQKYNDYIAQLSKWRE